LTTFSCYDPVEGLKKVCSKCKELLPLSSYSLQHNCLYGRTSVCRACKKAHNEENKVEIIERRRIDYLNNKEKILKKVKADYIKNRVKRLEKDRLYYRKIRDNMTEEERDVMLAKQRQDRADNPEKYKETERKRRAKRDPIRLLGTRLRGRLGDLFRKGIKSGSAVRDLGCSVEQLKEYLSILFWPGMSWDNKSKKGWHIDHILPIDSFNIYDRSELLVACNYTNLQPLWHDDNASKCSRFDWTPLESKHPMPYRYEIFSKTSWKVILPVWETPVAPN
jgi:hypothetical protein